MAASISETGEIAAIGGSGTIPPVVNYMRGYENGAHSVNADANVQLITYVSDDLTVAFNDPTAGKTFADQFLQQNADVDVMFQVAGKTGNGVLQSVERGGHLRHRRRRRPVGLHPGQRRVHRHQRREEADAGRLRGHHRHGRRARREAATSSTSADNEGIGLAPFYQFADLIDAETQAAIDDAFSQMASGDLDPCQPSGLCYAGEADPGT